MTALLRAGLDAAGHVIGVDIGSDISKAVLATTGGRILARATRTHDTPLPPLGWVAHDAEHVWWSDFCALIAQLTVQRLECRVDAMAISGLGLCALPADAAGKPPRPAILHGVDTREVDLGARSRDELVGADAVPRRGGSVMSPPAAGPELASIAQHEPTAFAQHEPTAWARTRRFFMAHTFLVNRLTGAYVLDRQSASQCLPLYDPHHGQWDSALADTLVPGLELPDLAVPCDVAGRLTSAAADRTGLPAGIPVAVGPGPRPKTSI